MPKHTHPIRSRPQSIAPVILGARLNLEPQRGDENAKLAWWFILARTPWDNSPRATWATNSTIAHDAGLAQRDAERAVSRLRGAGLLKTPTGKRTSKAGAVSFGRILEPRLGAPVKILVPGREDMATLWATCRTIRKLPASLVTLAVGLYVLACRHAGRKPSAWARVPGRMADVRRLVGARKGHGWTTRVRDLEDIGLLRRDATGIWLAPTSAWARMPAPAQVEEREADVIPIGRLPQLAPPARLISVADLDDVPAYVDEAWESIRESTSPPRARYHMGQIPLFDGPVAAPAEPKADPAEAVFAYLRERILATKTDLGIKPVRAPRILSKTDARAINARVVEYGDGDEAAGIEACKQVIDVDEADCRRQGEISGYWNATTPFRNAANFENRLQRWRADGKHSVFGGGKRQAKADTGFYPKTDDALWDAVTIGFDK